MSDVDSVPPEVRKNFETLLKQMENEDTLLLNRTGWLLTGQTFLLIGYLTAEEHLPIFSSFDINSAISAVGIATTLLIYVANLAAVRAFLLLRDRIHCLTSLHPGLPIRDLPLAKVGPGLLSPIVLSLIILFLWTTLYYQNLWYMKYLQNHLPIAAHILLCSLAFLAALSGLLFALYQIQGRQAGGNSIFLWTALASFFISIVGGISAGAEWMGILATTICIGSVVVGLLLR